MVLNSQVVITGIIQRMGQTSEEYKVFKVSIVEGDLVVKIGGLRSAP